MVRSTRTGEIHEAMGDLGFELRQAGHTDAVRRLYHVIEEFFPETGPEPWVDLCGSCGRHYVETRGMAGTVPQDSGRCRRCREGRW